MPIVSSEHPQIISSEHSQNLARELFNVGVLSPQEIKKFWYILQWGKGETFQQNFADYLCGLASEDNAKVELKNLSALIFSILNDLENESELTPADKMFRSLLLKIDQLLEIFLAGMRHERKPRCFDLHANAKIIYQAGRKFSGQNKQ